LAAPLACGTKWGDGEVPVSDAHITRYDKMPIPPVEQQTEYFVFRNPVRFYTSVNPDFFAGTRVEAEAARSVSQEAEAAAAGP
jgi:hypothetical protein